jgi:hypothetical protein
MAEVGDAVLLREGCSFFGHLNSVLFWREPQSLKRTCAPSLAVIVHGSISLLILRSRLRGVNHSANVALCFSKSFVARLGALPSGLRQ